MLGKALTLALVGSGLKDAILESPLVNSSRHRLLHAGSCQGAAACFPPLSVHSGGKPSLFPTAPAMPGARP